ncbi:hypothetical protein ACM7MR_29785 [Pseudomonas aeruginosa]
MPTEIDLDVYEPRELPAFNLEEHELMHSVQAEHLVLDVFYLGDNFGWELVDAAGRRHHAAAGFETDAHALLAGLTVALKPNG